MSFPFLDLPPELRTKILLLLLHYATPIPLEDLPQTYPHALLLSCAQIHTEVLPLYYSSNTFSLTLHRHNERSLLSPFLSSPSRHLIRSLKVSIQRWGANDYFVKSFAPAIEELILKGGLRRLEVVLREGYVLGLMRRKNESDDRNWGVLKRLLRDPYLEWARLSSIGVGEIFEEGPKDISWIMDHF
jgi:hypothetical protein